MASTMTITPEGQALLDVIAGTESRGSYDVVYGGSRFADYSGHPNKAVVIKSGPNAGQTSSAAGRYQFLGSTWNSVANKYNLPDFSPASQDKAAWLHAQDVYYAKTHGRDLQADLSAGGTANMKRVSKALHSEWTSLPGGIEQGQGQGRFQKTYDRALSGNAGHPVPPEGIPNGRPNIDLTSVAHGVGNTATNALRPLPFPGPLTEGIRPAALTATTRSFSQLAPDAMNGVGRLVAGQKAVLPTDFAENTGAPMDARTASMVAPAVPPKTISPALASAFARLGAAVAGKGSVDLSTARKAAAEPATSKPATTPPIVKAVAEKVAAKPLANTYVAGPIRPGSLREKIYVPPATASKPVTAKTVATVSSGAGASSSGSASLKKPATTAKTVTAKPSAVASAGLSVAGTGSASLKPTVTARPMARVAAGVGASGAGSMSLKPTGGITGAALQATGSGGTRVAAPVVQKPAIRTAPTITLAQLQAQQQAQAKALAAAQAKAAAASAAVARTQQQQQAAQPQTVSNFQLLNMQGNYAEGSPNASFEKDNGAGSVTKSMASSSRWNTGY